jgi:hypothetical protein
MIMYLDKSDTWKLYGDSLPYMPSAFNYTPPLKTLPTVILFVGKQLFVATESYGVLVWNPGDKWKTQNKGLLFQESDQKGNELFDPISFLEYFRGKLFVGYGNPAFTWGTRIGGTRKGLLKYRLDL